MEANHEKPGRQRRSAKGALKRASEHMAEEPPHSQEERTDQQTQTKSIILQTEPTTRVARVRKPGELRAAPPPVPKAVAKTSPLLPPHSEDASIRDAHDIHVIPIVRASAIQSKARQTINLLRAEQSRKAAGAGKEQTAEHRDLLIALVARGPDANKCISVAEIAKRGFAQEAKSQTFQYTGVWTRLEEFIPKAVVDIQNGLSDEEPENTPAFESFDFNERSKVRNVSCLVIYLACHIVAKLKYAYSEEILTPKLPAGT